MFFNEITKGELTKGTTLWLAWEEHRRTKTLCEFLDVYLIIYYSTYWRIFKYPLFIFKTIFSINRIKPEILFVQNPSIILTLLVCILKGLYGYKLFVDTHNGAIIPENYFLKKIPKLYCYFAKRSDYTIVSNLFLAAVIESRGGEPLVIPDRLPKLPEVQKIQLKNIYNVVFISTFGKDEPLTSLISAIPLLSNEIAVYVTGDSRKASHEIYDKLKDQVVFTGFLSDKDYWNLLYSADLILDLTTRTDCLVCGAYEAVSAGTPLILTDSLVLKEYFCKGVLFTDNSAVDIAEKISIGLVGLDNLKCDIAILREKIMESWLQYGKELKEYMDR